VNHITSYASNPVSTIKYFSGSFTIPREIERDRDRERERAKAREREEI
jgi:hypothetical protein